MECDLSTSNIRQEKAEVGLAYLAFDMNPKKYFNTFHDQPQ
jgi:hypothetical protein